MASLRKRGRNWFYKFTDANGRAVERKGCADKRVTEEMARAAESEVAKIRAGVLDPRDLALGAHEARPLAEHLADWRAYLLGKGSTAQHADLSHNRVHRLLGLTRSRRISDLSLSKIQGALKTVRDGDQEHRGVSLRSVHHYTRAVKGFSRWLWKDGRVREDPLAHLAGPHNPEQERPHERRALSAEELALVFTTAELGPVVLKLPGPDRAALYRVACGTGFRANELRSLTPESFRLDNDPPAVTVAAAYSKRRREDVQPIRPDLADTLRPWLASKAPGGPVFGDLTKHTNLLIQFDLARAGIPYRDAGGRVADFHALRHSYITALAKSSAPVKVVQALARHSTPTLTLGLYAHVGLYDQAGALDALPATNNPGPKREAGALPATGTDGGHISDRFATYLPLAGDVSGRELSVTGGETAARQAAGRHDEASRNPLDVEALDTSGRPVSAPGTAEGVGFEPTVGFHLLRFSRPSQSAALAPLRERRVGRASVAPVALEADFTRSFEDRPTFPRPRAGRGVDSRLGGQAAGRGWAEAGGPESLGELRQHEDPSTETQQHGKDPRDDADDGPDAASARDDPDGHGQDCPGEGGDGHPAREDEEHDLRLEEGRDQIGQRAQQNQRQRAQPQGAAGPGNLGLAPGTRRHVVHAGTGRDAGGVRLTELFGQVGLRGVETREHFQYVFTRELVGVTLVEEFEELRLHLPDDRQTVLAGHPPQQHPVDRVEPGVDQRLQRLRQLRRVDTHPCAPSSKAERDLETFPQLSDNWRKRCLPSTVRR